MVPLQQKLFGEKFTDIVGKAVNIKQVIQSDVEKSIKKAGLFAAIPVEVAYPSDPGRGDYAINWPLQAAREINQSPLEIAKKIQEGLAKSEVYDQPQIVEPGFINFRLSNEFLGKHLNLVLAEGERFGASLQGKDQTVVIEFSSPNIAKPMNIGHLRNTNLGQALVNIFKFNSYQTISDNHIGDWGTQFGKLLYAYKNWGQNQENIDIKGLLALYVRFHDETKSDDKLEAAAREEFRKLEQGDEENRRLWEKFRTLSLREFDRAYQELGAKFDFALGESSYEKDLPRVVDEAIKSGAAKRDPDGSVIIPLEGMPPFLILKSDGATLYGTRDLATAKYRIEKFNPTQVLYVIASEQSLYLRQLFSSLQKLGWGKEIKWVHVSYGLTRLPQGKMSTRSGELVTADEVLTEAKKQAAAVIKEKDLSPGPDQKLIEAVAVGAIKWNDLKISRESEVLFDWQQVFSIEGNTGPYMQYSYARTENILSRTEGLAGSTDTTLLQDPLELELLRRLVRFPEQVEAAAADYHPHLIAQFAFDLAQEFSRFYEKCPVLTADPGLKQARIALVRAVGTTLKTSLSLLGISAPSRL